MSEMQAKKRLYAIFSQFGGQAAEIGGKTLVCFEKLDLGALCRNYLFEGNPVGDGTTRRGTDTPVHCPETPVGSTHSLKRGLRPPEQLERQAEFPSSDKTRPNSPLPTLQGP